MVKKWEEIGRKKISDHYIFELVNIQRVSPRTGNTHTFVQVDSPDWINIIPVTTEGEVVLIHQYRHGTSAVTIEIPGGMIDPHEDDPAEAAKRELLEETGFSAETVIKIGMVDANPAFMTNRTHLYLALGAKKIREPEFDGSEDIAVELVPVDSLRDMVISGKITHSLVVCAFYHFEYWRTQNPDGLML